MYISDDPRSPTQNLRSPYINDIQIKSLYVCSDSVPLLFLSYGLLESLLEQRQLTDKICGL